ncbi:hypothetical protein FHS89_003255, partial [Rubricella aquisinus]
MRISQQDIQAIEPLTPLQKGMLFHSVSHGESGAYVEQLTATLSAELDDAAFRTAWDRALRDVEMLRSAFLPEQRPEPLRVVLKQAALPLEHLDWSDQDAEAQQQRLTALMTAEKDAGFDLTRPPLMRLKLVRMGAGDTRLIWTFHHLLLDGWSIPLLMQRVLSAYEAATRGTALTPPPLPGFAAYRKWMTTRPSAESYWRETLRGHAHGAPLAFGVSGLPRSRIETREYRETADHLPADLNDALARQAEHLGVTFASLVELAALMALRAFTGQSDLILGTTVSGRPHGVAGMDEMIGMFINTLPLRADLPPDRPLRDAAQTVLSRLAALQERAETPLHDIRQWARLPADESLFETIFVFENYPVAAGLSDSESALGIRDVHVEERTGYPLTIVAARTGGLSLKLIADTGYFSAPLQVEFATVLRSVCSALAVASPDQPLSALLPPRGTALPAEQGAASPNHDTSLISQVFMPHDGVALMTGSGDLDYTTLHGRVEALSRCLVGMGVCVGGYVGVLTSGGFGFV